MKCIYSLKCQNTGDPAPGNDAYICPECLAAAKQKALEAWAGFRKRLLRHQNN